MTTQTSSMADVQQEIIDRARDLLQPSAVKTGRIPPWLRWKLRAAKREGRIDPAGESDTWLLQAAVVAAGGGGLWMDHWGRTDWNFKDVFVTEPYHFEEEPVRRFAELLDLDYRVSANSWHYPGSTFRILFFPKEN